MEYRTEVLHLEKKFPFAIFKGNGFSLQDFQEGNVYMHNHYCLEINYVLSSGGTYYISENSYSVNANDIFIINNYEYHYAVNENSSMELMVIIFDPDLVWQNEQMDYQYIKAFYEWKDGFKHRLSGENFVSKDIIDILTEMDKEWSEKAVGYRLVIKSLLLKLLALLYRRFEVTGHYSEKVMRFQNEYMRIIDAIAYIDDNYREQMKLSELADKVHMNSNYFSTYFRNVMKCTVSTYIIKKRLKYACLQLTTSEGSIIDIAADSGFSNVSYFNRTFKEIVGMSPKQYRENASIRFQ